MIEAKELPKGWKLTKLGEVADYLNGRAFKPTEWEESGRPIIRIQNLNNSGAKYNYSKAKYEERCSVKKGDLLFAWSASLGAYIWKGQDAWLNQHIFKVVPKADCDKKYLFYCLDKLVTELYAKAHGSGMVHVTKGKFEATDIFLPPLSEQHRIVSKLEELLSELEKGKEQLCTALDQLKVYRQAVLKYAFEGNLTAEYRRQNTGDRRKQETDNGELPKGWKWVKFGDVFNGTPQNGIYKPASKYGKGIRIIRIDGFYNGCVLDNYEYKRLELSVVEKAKYKLGINDLLINRVNSIPYLGKCGLVKSLPESTVFESNIMRIKLNQTIVNPRFISNYLSTQRGLTELRKNAKHAVNQASINQTDVSNVSIPLPEIKEQNSIVEEIESRLSVADKLEETITASLQQSETLRQSILKKAFEGGLLNEERE
jgi:type I restriction enzyme S subunit